MSKIQEGLEYRKATVKRLAMTEREQDLCWGMLNGIQSAVINRDAAACALQMGALEHRVAWLRSDEGKKWVAENMSYGF